MTKMIVTSSRGQVEIIMTDLPFEAVVAFLKKEERNEDNNRPKRTGLEAPKGNRIGTNSNS